MVDLDKLKTLPKVPGVYLYKDATGKVIYVGKANNLNNRVRQYFQSSRNLDHKTKALVSNIDDFSFITTGTEMEAFILESNLIKKHSPKYNILLKDDKTYPYIKVTTSEKFPRVMKTREYKKNEDTYFGPYSDAGAVNRMVEFINQVFPTKKCNRTEFPPNFRPCLNFHIQKCKGICKGKLAKAEYDVIIKDILDFLNGKDKSIDRFLEEKMKEASEKLDYEEALKYRDYLYAAKAVREKQRVVLSNKEDVDVVLFGGEGKVIIFSVIESKLVDRQMYRVDYSLTNLEDKTDIVLEFIRQHYSRETKGPQQIIIDRTGVADFSKYRDNIFMIEGYLKELWDRKVEIIAPQKGEMKALLSLAKADLLEQKNALDEKIIKEEDRERRLIKELKPFGDFSFRPRIEAYDISNTFGVDSVGALVAFEGMKPNKSRYRKFKVKSKPENGVGSDDYASTQEIIFRRLKKAIDGDKGFLPLPEIIFLDGGKGHLDVAEQVLKTAMILMEKEEREFLEEIKGGEILTQGDETQKKDIEERRAGLKKIKLIGMAKDSRHRSSKLVFRDKDGEVKEYELKGNQFLFSYIGNIQEEVHRFAITYHKSLRGKNVTKSELENIKGIGKTKRNSLLNHFGSLKVIREATVDEIAKADKITKADAAEIHKYFNH